MGEWRRRGEGLNWKIKERKGRLEGNRRTEEEKSIV